MALGNSEWCWRCYKNTPIANDYCPRCGTLRGEE